jgi:hypothetical protein
LAALPSQPEIFLDLKRVAVQTIVFLSYVRVIFVDVMSFIPEQKQGFFGRLASSVQRTIIPPRDPTEAVRGWTKQLRAEARNVDKSIRGMQ